MNKQIIIGFETEYDELVGFKILFNYCSEHKKDNHFRCLQDKVYAITPHQKTNLEKNKITFKVLETKEFHN